MTTTLKWKINIDFKNKNKTKKCYGFTCIVVHKVLENNVYKCDKYHKAHLFQRRIQAHNPHRALLNFFNMGYDFMFISKQISCHNHM